MSALEIYDKNLVSSVNGDEFEMVNNDVGGDLSPCKKRHTELCTESSEEKTDADIKPVTNNPRELKTFTVKLPNSTKIDANNTSLNTDVDTVGNNCEPKVLGKPPLPHCNVRKSATNSVMPPTAGIHTETYPKIFYELSSQFQQMSEPRRRIVIIGKPIILISHN